MFQTQENGECFRHRKMVNVSDTGNGLCFRHRKMLNVSDTEKWPLF